MQYQDMRRRNRPGRAREVELKIVRHVEIPPMEGVLQFLQTRALSRTRRFADGVYIGNDTANDQTWCR